MSSPWKITYADGKAEVTYNGEVVRNILKASIEILPTGCSASITIVNPDLFVVPDFDVTKKTTPAKRNTPGEWDVR